MKQKDDMLYLEGVVVDSCKGIFQVLLETDNKMLAKLSGNIKNNNIMVLVGDRVTVEVPAVDTSQGRIVFRHKK